MCSFTLKMQQHAFDGRALLGFAAESIIYLDCRGAATGIRKGYREWMWK